MRVQVPWVYLARHGETEWNVEGRRQGQLDSPLTPAGREQARRVAAVLAHQGIDAVFASPLGRAASTAEVIARAAGRPVTTLDELAEVHHGEFAGLTEAQIRATYPGALEAREGDKYRWRFPGGESYADADERAGRALARVAAGQPRRALIVSHEMIGRMLLRHLLGLSPQDALSRNQPHDVVYQVDTATAELTVLPAGLAGPPPDASRTTS